MRRREAREDFMGAFSQILFAQRNRGEALRDSAGPGREDVLLGLLIAVALIAGVWAFSRLMGMYRARRKYNAPWPLFRALCKAHGLNWSDRCLLARIARQRCPAHPGRLFVEAQHWEETALGPGFALEFDRVRALRAKILGESPGSRGAQPPARKATVAPPLFPAAPTPTLDLPPWTAEREV
jgi:hypothetical protein